MYIIESILLKCCALFYIIVGMEALLIDWDHTLFEFINSGISNPFFDAVLPLLREKLVWIPLYIFLFAFLLLNFGRKGYWLILMLVVTVGISDLMSSKVIKPWVERARPCHDGHTDLHVELRARCGRGFSFTSSHATNHFAVAFFLFLVYRGKRKWIKGGLMFWAASISFAQVYVGVHFPIDIFCGAILGMMIAFISFGFYSRHFPNPFDQIV